MSFFRLSLVLALASCAAFAAPGDTPCTRYTPIDKLPFSIAEPGLYRVSANLSSASGITVTSSDVTIDLNGFLLEGEAGAAIGIFVGDTYSNIVIRDGTLRNWTTGVNALAASASRIERLRVFGCASHAIIASGSSEVRACLVIDCGNGIAATSSSRVTDCVVRGGDTGIDLGSGAAVARSIVSGTKLAGVRSDAGAHVTQVISRDNTGVGMELGPGAHVSRCIVSDNAGKGIVGAANGSIDRVIASDNGGTGIDVVSATDDGRTSIRATVSARNGSHGIRTTSATLIADTVTAENFGHGVRAEDYCNIHHLLSVNNTNFGAGIYLEFSDSRIHDNHLVGNQYGLWAAGTYNEMTHNSARDNVIDYSIASPNVFGPASSSPATAGAFANIDH